MRRWRTMFACLLPLLFQEETTATRTMAINQIISSCRFWMRKQLTKVGLENVSVSSKCCGQLLMVWGSKLMLHHSNARSLLTLKGWLGTKMFLLRFCQRGSSNGWWKRVLFFSKPVTHVAQNTRRLIHCVQGNQWWTDKQAVSHQSTKRISGFSEILLPSQGLGTPNCLLELDWAAGLEALDSGIPRRNNLSANRRLFGRSTKLAIV